MVKKGGEFVLDAVERTLEVGGEVPREGRTLSSVPRCAQVPGFSGVRVILHPFEIDSLLHDGRIGRYSFKIREALHYARDDGA